MANATRSAADSVITRGRQHSNGEGFPHLNSRTGACMCKSACCFGKSGCACPVCSGRGHVGCPRGAARVEAEIAAAALEAGSA